MTLRRTERDFWERVEKSDGCWLWQGSIAGTGYGQFVMDGTHWSTHRLSYMLHHGTIPAGSCVLHSCDVRRCVNPVHLRLGTKKDNAVDAAERGRSGLLGDKNWQRRYPERRQRGARNPAAKLTEQNVRDIRESPEATAALATRYGVALSTIIRARSKKTW